MAKVIASATLAATIMPLLSRHVRQPVMVGKHDINFSRHIDQNPKDEGNDTTVPSILFGENIVPTTSGYKSVTFTQVMEALPAGEEVVAVHLAVGEASGVEPYSFILLITYGSSLSANGYRYHVFWQDDFGGIQSIVDNGFGTAAYDGPKISVATIKNRTFSLFDTVGGNFYFEHTYIGMFSASMYGLPAEVRGIFAASGYMLAWDDSSIYWSALEDPTDFVPSDVTGAGGTRIVDLLGRIKFCKATQGGFIVYGDLNCVFAQASNDFRFPFIFKAVPYLVGIADRNDVSYGASMEHVVKSGSAIYKLSKAQVTPAFQDFYTFLSSKKGERFIDEGYILEEYPLDNTDVMFTVVDGSATVLSYKSEAAEEYDYALIDFSNLGRQGKVKVAHSFVITWPFDSVVTSLLVTGLGDDLVSEFEETLVSELGESYTITEGINVICFVAKDGSMKLLLDLADAPANGTIILGPFQLVRENTAELTRVEATVATIGGTSCAVLTSITGDRHDMATDLLSKTQLGKKVRYNSRVTGLNHSICIQGAFDLSSVLLELVPRAQR
jgi:hypothetical protein